MIDPQWKTPASARTRFFFYSGLLAIAAGFARASRLMVRTNYIFRPQDAGNAMDVAFLIIFVGIASTAGSLVSWGADIHSRHQRSTWIR